MFLVFAAVFPGAVPYYDGEHIWTWIDGDFYDITGRMSKEEAMIQCDKGGMRRLPHPDHRPGPGTDGWGMSNPDWKKRESNE